jgi:hypothetical protein
MDCHVSGTEQTTDRHFLKCLLKKVDLHPRNYWNVDCFISYRGTTKSFHSSLLSQNKLCFFFVAECLEENNVVAF